MTSIPPASAVPPTPSASTLGVSAVSAPPASPAGADTAVLTQLPGNLQSAAGPGMVISGTVVSIDDHGQALLQTNSGTISFTTSATLTVGQQISLQIQAAGSQLQAVILTQGPGSRSAATLTGSLATADLAEALATPAATVAPSVATGSIIVATVIGAATA